MQQQNQDATLLEQVYHSAEMGERGTELLIKKSKDGGLSSKLGEFRDEYASIKKDAADQLSAHGKAPKKASTLETSAQWMGVQLSTLADQSPARMAEMLVTGSAKNIIKGIEDIKQNHEAQHQTRKLAGRLVALENDSFNAMKTYLN
ncbi:MAG: hypothetical protein FWE19_01690 [Oscillospiraceae bacterium]|nr:hypothetical protein [Oscillospiraceae bacterium]